MLYESHEVAACSKSHIFTRGAACPVMYSCDAACRILRKHVPRMPVTHHAMPDRTEQAGPKQGLSQLRNSGWSKPGSGPAVKPLRK